MSVAAVDIDWTGFDRDGFTRLGVLVDADELRSLRDRIDQIMLGRADIPYDQLMMQLDPGSSSYGDLGDQTLGFKGPTTAYRKIEGLEADAVFRTWIQHPVAAQICRRIHGEGVPIGLYRAMFMNKPASAGTKLPWHQDRWMQLDRDPVATIYLALDPATTHNGCVEIVVGSHASLVNPAEPSAFLEPSQYAEHCPVDRRLELELEAGEVVLLHNWLVHRSGVNESERPRRAFSACYLDARTVDAWGLTYPVVFDGTGRPTDVSERTPVSA